MRGSDDNVDDGAIRDVDEDAVDEDEAESEDCSDFEAPPFLVKTRVRARRHGRIVTKPTAKTARPRTFIICFVCFVERAW